MNYVDIHTHKPITKESIKVQNLIAGIDKIDNLSDNGYYSAGIHPWYVDDLNLKHELLAQIASKKNILAIGECGFDPKSSLNFQEQENLLVKQAQLAETLQKPLIIHCVKMFNDLIRVKKTIKTTIPWIIHGFSANQYILNECLKQGFYYSLGKQLLNPKSPLMSIVHYIPVNNLFFETDECDLNVKEIYSFYAKTTHQNLDELRDTIYANFVRIFIKNNG